MSLIKYKIFILSSERSGTNLLQKLLSNHKYLFGPKTPQLFNTMGSSIRHFGDLNQMDNQNRLISSLISICNHSFSNWSLPPELEQKLVSRHKFIESICSLYEIKAKMESCNGFIAKELNMQNQVDQILEIYPDAKFIHLVRNPLEQAASWMKTPLFFSTPIQVTQEWKIVQNKVLELKSKYPDSIITLRYEDLVSNTREQMKAVLTFCNLEEDTNCYANEIRREGDDGNDLWKNVNISVFNNADKHTEELSAIEIQSVKKLAQPIASELNYFNDTPNPSGWLLVLSKYKRIFISKRRRENIRGRQGTMLRVKFANDLKMDIQNEFNAKS
ncbi:MAG: hypothetical protein ACJA2N_000611 [Salibacteraceae bacterium]|jgi:hypothetical protein